MPFDLNPYLLPRVLDALAADDCPDVIALEVSLNRFGTGNPDRWSTSQWQVLDRFQQAYIERSARRRDHSLDAVLCMFRLGGWPRGDRLAVATFYCSDAMLERATTLALADGADPALARKAARVAETIEESRRDHFRTEQQ